MKLYILLALQRIFLTSAADIPICVANTLPEVTADLCMSCSAADAYQCTPCSQDGCMDGVYSIQYDDEDAWSMTHLTITSSSKDAQYDPDQVIISGSNNYGVKWTRVKTQDLSWNARSSKNLFFFDNEKKYTSYQIELLKLDGTNIMYIEDIRNPKMDPPPTEAPTEAPTDTPTNSPTDTPTNSPTDTPTNSPTTAAPTSNPTNAPTSNPTNAPTRNPTNAPTRNPTNAPTSNPTNTPTNAPTKSLASTWLLSTSQQKLNLIGNDPNSVNLINYLKNVNQNLEIYTANGAWIRNIYIPDGSKVPAYSKVKVGCGSAWSIYVHYRNTPNDAWTTTNVLRYQSFEIYLTGNKKWNLNVNYNWIDEDNDDTGVITFLTTEEVQDAQNRITAGETITVETDIQLLKLRNDSWERNSFIEYLDLTSNQIKVWYAKKSNWPDWLNLKFEKEDYGSDGTTFSCDVASNASCNPFAKSAGNKIALISLRFDPRDGGAHNNEWDRNKYTLTGTHYRVVKPPMKLNTQSKLNLIGNDPTSANLIDYLKNVNQNLEIYTKNGAWIQKIYIPDGSKVPEYSKVKVSCGSAWSIYVYYRNTPNDAWTTKKVLRYQSFEIYLTGDKLWESWW